MASDDSRPPFARGDKSGFLFDPLGDRGDGNPDLGSAETVTKEDGGRSGSGGAGRPQEVSGTVSRRFDNLTQVVLTKLNGLIRSRYLMTYKPGEFEANGKCRPIEIVAQKDGRRLQAHAREGYRALASPRPTE